MQCKRSCTPAGVQLLFVCTAFGRSRGCCSSAVPVGLWAFQIQIPAVGIQDDSQGHVLHGQAADSLTAEVGPGDDLQRLDTLGHQGTGTAQSSQIDRTVADNGFLNASQAADGQGYCVFGRVVKGQDVVDKIAEVRTGVKAGMRDVPVKPVTIVSARML